MRFAVGFALCIAMVAVWTIAVGSHVADEVSQTLNGAADKINRAMRSTR